MNKTGYDFYEPVICIKSGKSPEDLQQKLVEGDSGEQPEELNKALLSNNSESERYEKTPKQSDSYPKQLLYRTAKNDSDGLCEELNLQASNSLYHDLHCFDSNTHQSVKIDEMAIHNEITHNCHAEIINLLNLLSKKPSLEKTRKGIQALEAM